MGEWKMGVKGIYGWARFRRFNERGYPLKNGEF